MARIPVDERRALLVQAALRVIAANGVSDATTRAIVAEAGMSLASFHYAFRSHDEMMRELVAYVVGAESSAALATFEPGSDIRSSIRAGLQGFLNYVIADPGHEQVLRELVHYAMRTPGLEHLAREQYESYRHAVTEMLAGLASVSAVTWAIPVTDVARLAVTMTDGVTLAWLADRDAVAAARILDLAADCIAVLARPTPALPTPALPTSAVSPIRSIPA